MNPKLIIIFAIGVCIFIWIIIAARKTIPTLNQKKKKRWWK